MGRRTTGLLVALVLVLGAACDRAPRPTPGGPTPTAEGRDVSVVPSADDVDLRYVNAVLARLDPLLGEALREAMRAGEVTAEARAAYEAVYVEPALSAQLDLLAEEIERGTVGLLEPIGAPRTTAREILNRAEGCVVVETRVDYSEVVHSPPPPPEGFRSFAGLRAKAPGEDEAGRNPTAWMIFGTWSSPVGSPPEDPEDSASPGATAA
jgi:hypothetical protein